MSAHLYIQTHIGKHNKGPNQARLTYQHNLFHLAIRWQVLLNAARHRGFVVRRQVTQMVLQIKVPSFQHICRDRLEEGGTQEDGDTQERDHGQSYLLENSR